MPTFDKFEGINNVSAEERLSRKELREATNVDIDDTERLRLRKGATNAYTGVDCHSLWGNGPDSFFVEGDTLKSFDSISGLTSSLRTGLQREREMAYVDVVGDVYYSNGKSLGMIRNGVSRSWGVELPSRIPDMAAVAGALHPGTYFLTLCFVRDDGEESGAIEAGSITLDSAGGIDISNIPQPSESDVSLVRIYMTAASGEEFYKADEFLVGVTTRTISSAELTVPLRHYLVTPPPAGDLLELYNGSLYIASGSYLYFTLPHAYGMCRPHKDFFQFSKDIDMLGAVEDGLFVSADKIYFIPFSKAIEASPIAKAPYKAVKGTMVKTKAAAMGLEGDEQVIVCYTEQGVCVGTNGGGFINLTYEKYAPQETGSAGSAMLREEDGISQYVGLVKKGGNSGRLYASDIAVAEIVRNGVIID